MSPPRSWRRRRQVRRIPLCRHGSAASRAPRSTAPRSRSSPTPLPSSPAWSGRPPPMASTRSSRFVSPFGLDVLGRIVARSREGDTLALGFLLYDLGFWEILGLWWGGSGHVFMRNLGFDTRYSELHRLLHRYGSIDHIYMKSMEW